MLAFLLVLLILLFLLRIIIEFMKQTTRGDIGDYVILMLFLLTYYIFFGGY